MKKITALLLLLSNISFAQTNPKQTPSQFDSFIIKPEIEWASNNDDTIRFTKPNLNKLLAWRYEKNEISGSLPLSFNRPLKYTRKKLIDEDIPVALVGPIYDSLGRVIKFPDPPIVDSSLFTIIDIKEILYIEKGLLKSYVPLVSPMRSISTSMGIFLGYSDYFSTCFNFDHTYQSGKQNKIVFLLQTNRKIAQDSIMPEYKLKELYGRNLAQTLWPYILKNKYEIVSLKANRRLNATELNTALINEVTVKVPVVDSSGKITSRTYIQDLSPDVFTAIELKQDWYYDHTKNIVFNKIREVYLYAKKWTSEGQDKESSPILKIVFK